MITFNSLIIIITIIIIIIIIIRSIRPSYVYDPLLLAKVRPDLAKQSIDKYNKKRKEYTLFNFGSCDYG